MADIARWTAGMMLLAAACSGADLDREAAKRVERMRETLGEEFVVERDGVFIVAGNLPHAQFRRFQRHTIHAGAELLWRAYCSKKPDYLITIYLFRDDQSYRHWAKELFDDTDVSHFGYYRPWDQTLVMNIGTGGGTLVHELTHALVKPDFPDIPTWFDEGLASLHEQCRFGRDSIVGLTNWRLAGLQQAIRQGRLVPLEKLVATTTAEFRGRNEALHYAEARYLCLYLQKLGLLRRYYREFRDSVADDPTGATTLVAVTGKPIDELQREWVPWVGKLRYP